MPDPLPAAAQGDPQAAHRRCTRWRRSPRAGWRSSGATPARDRAGRRGGRRWPTSDALRAALSQPGALLFVGERLATVDGWTVRRRGAGQRDRRAAGLGAAPGRRPGCGRRRLPAQPAARRSAGHRRRGPGRAGRRLAAQDRHDPRLGRPGHRRDHRRGGAAVGSARWWSPGVDPADLADPALAERALDEVGFLVSLEVRHSAVTERADVVLPGRSGRGEGRHVPRLGGSAAALRCRCWRPPRCRTPGCSTPWPAQMGVELGCADVAAIRRELGFAADEHGPAGWSPRGSSRAPRPRRAPGEARARHLASAHRRSAACSTATSTWPGRPGRRSCGSARHRASRLGVDRRRRGRR